MRYQAELVTGPAVEPLTLAEAKKHLEISSSDSTHDTHLNAAIQEAREQWEHDTDSVCCYQTWKLRIPYLHDGLRLPKTPVSSITSIQYYDGANNLQTWASSNYQLHVSDIRVAYRVVMPAVADRWDAWTITYRLGYSQDGSLVPAIAKRAMLLLIGYYFENRDMLMSDAMYTQKPYEALVLRFMRSNYP